MIAFVSDRTRLRGVYLGLFGVFAVTGYAILRTSRDSHAKYGAVFLVALGTFPNGPGFIAWGINSKF
jgi:hypothetical protein